MGSFCIDSPPYTLGVNRRSRSEFDTTVTELNAIAPPARNGRTWYIPAPRNGTRIPAATGIRATL